MWVRVALPFPGALRFDQGELVLTVDTIAGEIELRECIMLIGQYLLDDGGAQPVHSACDGHGHWSRASIQPSQPSCRASRLTTRIDWYRDASPPSGLGVLCVCSNLISETGEIDAAEICQSLGAPDRHLMPIGFDHARPDQAPQHPADVDIGQSHNLAHGFLRDGNCELADLRMPLRGQPDAKLEKQIGDNLLGAGLAQSKHPFSPPRRSIAFQNIQGVEEVEVIVAKFVDPAKGNIRDPRVGQSDDAIG